MNLGANGRQVARLVAATAVVSTLIAPAATAHFADFTGGETQDWYTDPFKRSFILQSGSQANPDYIRHSYSFVSANDTANTEFLCAILGIPPGLSASAGPTSSATATTRGLIQRTTWTAMTATVIRGSPEPRTKA